jgi:hypothetical protein
MPRKLYESPPFRESALVYCHTTHTFTDKYLRFVRNEAETGDQAAELHLHIFQGLMPWRRSIRIVTRGSLFEMSSKLPDQSRLALSANAWWRTFKHARLRYTRT